MGGWAVFLAHLSGAYAIPLVLCIIRHLSCGIIANLIQTLENLFQNYQLVTEFLDVVPNNPWVGVINGALMLVPPTLLVK